MRAGDPRASLRLRAGCPAEGADPGRGRAAPACAGRFGPGTEVEVEVTYRVAVARLPFLGSVAGPGITIGTTHHTRVDRYRGLDG
jgi:hypothetical protein